MKKLKHLFCIALAAVVTMTSLAITPMETKADDDTIISVPITVQEEYDLAENFYELLNQKRTEAGKYNYILNDGLMDLAMERAAQSCIYYGHTSMVYDKNQYKALAGTYIDKYKSYPNTLFLQENIAEGYANAKSVYTAWHNSTGTHNSLMMDDTSYKYCGIGVVTYHGKIEWVLVVSNVPVGNTIESVSGTKTMTRDIRTKTKYLAGGTISIKGLNKKSTTPFKFADLDGNGRAGYCTEDFPYLFTYKNNTPNIIDVDSQGIITTKAAGTGSFTVYYKGTVELCTVTVNVSLSYKDMLALTPTPSPKPTEPPKQTETAKPTITPDPQPPKQTETTKPAEPPKQTEPSKPVKPVSRKLTVKVKNVTYNGKAQKPAITVYAGKKKLSSKYYTVSYKNNKNVGYGTVVVKGKGRYGKYSGTAVFKINLKKTKLSSAKSTKKKTFTATWRKTGGNSGWQVQYSTNKKFRSGVRTVNLKSRNTKLTVRKLRSRKTYYIRVRGYKKVKGKIMYAGWSNVKKVKVK